MRDPWLWQATVGQRPAGPAALVFFTERTRYFESTGVLVDRDGAYRLIPIGIAEGHGLLSRMDGTTSGRTSASCWTSPPAGSVER
ncbi:hypothetical protein NKG94_46770 [Micromonospora sp. M12]